MGGKGDSGEIVEELRLWIMDLASDSVIPDRQYQVINDLKMTLL